MVVSDELIAIGQLSTQSFQRLLEMLPQADFRCFSDFNVAVQPNAVLALAQDSYMKEDLLLVQCFDECFHACNILRCRVCWSGDCFGSRT